MNQYLNSEQAIRNLKKVSDLRDFYHKLANFRFKNSSFKNAASVYMDNLKKQLEEFIKINKTT